MSYWKENAMKKITKNNNNLKVFICWRRGIQCVCDDQASAIYDLQTANQIRRKRKRCTTQSGLFCLAVGISTSLSAHPLTFLFRLRATYKAQKTKEFA